MNIRQHSMLVLLCFSISFWYATRINASFGDKVSSVKYDTGSAPAIAFISSGTYADCIAEVHNSSKLSNSCDLWFNIFDQTGKKKVHFKYKDSASNPSIAFISSGTYAGYIAIAYQDGDLWFDILDPDTQEKVVHFKYKEKASNPSIAFISSGTYAGYIAEVHEENDGLWFDILKQDGEVVVNFHYYDGQGTSPSIAFISSGTYSGYIAELHQFKDRDDFNLLLGILTQDGTVVVRNQYEYNGLVPSVAFIPSGYGYIAGVYQDYQKSKLWLNILDQETEKSVNGDSVEYDEGKLPSIVFIPSGTYAGYIAEAHLGSGVGDDLWFDIISIER